MDLSGMIHVYSLPKSPQREDKTEREWYLYQKDGETPFGAAD